MKRTLSIILLILLSNNLTGQTTQQVTSAQALNAFQERFDDAKMVAQALFNPIFVHTNPPGANPYPTTSINEKAIEALFGPGGLNVDQELLRYIKNFYFYLEYVARVEFAAKLAAYARQKNIDVTTVLETHGWQGIIDALKAKGESWSQLVLNKLRTFEQVDFQDVQGTIVTSSWNGILKTPFWQLLTIIPDVLAESSVWQEYLKYVITQTFNQDSRFIASIYETEKSIFRFIPNIEVAYYHPDFTQLRNASEFARLHLILVDDIRTRLLPQSREWKKTINVKTAQTDLNALYALSQTYAQSPFYTLISYAQTTPLGDVAQQALQKKLPIDPNLLQQPLVQEKLLIIAMIKNLQALTYYLFDNDHVDATMKVLANPAIERPIPNFLLYSAQDAIFVQDLAALIANLVQQASGNAQSKKFALQRNKKTSLLPHNEDDDTVIVQDFGHWLSQAWADIKKTGKDVWQGIKDSAKTIIDEAKAIGLATKAGFISALDPQKGKAILAQSKTLQEQVQQDFSDAVRDAQSIITDVGSVAKDAVGGVAEIVGKTLEKITKDPKLGSDVEGIIDATADVLVDYFADATNVVIGVAAATEGAAVRLAVDAVNLASTIIVDSVIASRTGEWQALGQDVVDNFKSIASNIATSIMSAASFTVQFYKDQLKDLIKFSGYLVSLLTDIFIDNSKIIFHILGTLFSGWEGGQQAMVTAEQWLENHRRLIEGVETTGLLVAVTVATDGAALPVLAMNAGPQLFQVYGGYQTDEKSVQKLAEERAFVANYQTYVANNKIISTNAKNAWSEELKTKYQAQIVNEERNLGFYQNFMNAYFESMENQMSYYLGQALQAELTPDKNGLIPADVGSLYGFKTGVYNLNPSQGFPLYSKARNAFSQEIAVSPALAMAGQEETSVTTPRKFWFNQKETVLLQSPTSLVEIRWQAMYTLNSFYIGLYFGGTYIDLEAIKKTGYAPINAAHLAKMLVYKKEGKDSVPTLGLYEHEGIGWVQEQINGPTFSLGIWYRMKMKLNNTSLQYKIWQEPEQEPAQWQSTTVFATDQRTIGVISSGASIQYQIITPEPSIQRNNAVRPPFSLQSEQERERGARKELAQLMNPGFGTVVLQPSSKADILKAHYIYTTQATQLKNGQQQPIDDYVVFAQTYKEGSLPKAQNIGMSPKGITNRPEEIVTPNALVSLISGNVYDTTFKRLTTYQNVLRSYTTQFGPLSDALTSQLASLRSAYLTTLQGPFSFGALTLQAINTQELESGHFIYKATSPAPQLRDAQNNPVKDTQGTQIYDYFVVVTTERNQEYIGAPYDQETSRIRSLVTGNEYGRSSTTPVETGHRPADNLRIYQQTFGQLSQPLLTAITTGQTFYQQRAQAPDEQQETAQGAPTQQTSPGDVSSKGDTYTGQSSGGTQPIHPTPGKSSIQDRTQEASGGDWSFGG